MLNKRESDDKKLFDDIAANYVKKDLTTYCRVARKLRLVQSLIGIQQPIKKILEVGTFTGLSALSMSLALPVDGSLIALDRNSETNKIAIDFFKKAKQEKKIKTIIKPAIESIEELKKENNYFDIVFIDADKDNYKKYYESTLELTKKNGLIIIDNVLWHGEVADENNNEKYTNIIRDFNEHVKSDKKTEQVIIPLGDGFTVCRKL